jgi:arsenite methyltransferase
VGEGTGLRYGADGYPYLVGLTAATVGLAGAGLAGTRSARGRLRLASWASLALGAAAAVPAALGARYVLRGKLALRDDLLGRVVWRGDETVADLGSGAGLLGVGAARRTTGTVHCIDLFVGKDLSGNSPERLLRNARRAGVAERVDVRREDVRSTSLADGSVDVVLSTLCLHNIPTGAGRRQALAEVVRVLRPGGTVVLSDLAHVEDEYAPALRAAGLAVRTHGRLPGTFPPQRLLTAAAP